jgi:hypothetical protein
MVIENLMIFAAQARESRIKQIINEEFKPGQTYDIAVLGRDILNEEYITYGKHFLINSESDPNAVITKIEGNILVNSASLNSGEIEVTANDEDLESGLRLIVFLIRSVSFDLEVKKLANKLLLSESEKKRTKINNKKELLKLNTKNKALFNCLPCEYPASNLINNFAILINNHHTNNSGINGSLYQYKNIQIFIPNTSIVTETACDNTLEKDRKLMEYNNKEENIITNGIVYKNNYKYLKIP